jgi:tetratricopeptide (TPR) repeat protein
VGSEVFISYRSADAAFGAAATYELLAERFGKERIFLDNQSMPPGIVYPGFLRSALESMRVLLVLIGPNWLGADPAGGDLLIERDGDWVRYEIRRAVERAVPIVPVLLDGTALPAPAVLPPDIRRLAHHQTAQVWHQHLGVDVERLASRIADLLPASQRPDIATGRLVPQQLPAGGGWFVGRAKQLAELDVLLGLAEHGRVNVVVISGTAGVGKTGLAVHWAHRAAEAFPDGQLYVDLRGYSTERPLSSGEALAGLLRGLGVARPEELGGTEERAARYRTLLSERRVLVLLDNARSVAQIRPLLPGGGPSVVLATSRHQLGGLAVHHAAEHLRLSPLDPSHAVELLRAIIGQRVAAEPDAADALAAYCSNLPLVLRIAAERAGARSMLGLGDLVEEMANERARLDVLDSGDPYSTVRTVLSWSFQGLDDRSAAAFRALGAHPGHTFAVPAVAALTATSRSGANAAVRALTDAHLVTEWAPGRYSMHDLLHVYSREIADRRPEECRNNLRRLFDHYLHTCDRADRLLISHWFRMPLAGDPNAGLAIDDPTTARRWLETEQANLVAMCRVDDPMFDSRRWQLAFVLRGFFYLTKQLDAWVDTHTQALAACLRAGNNQAEAVTRNYLGLALAARGQLEEAISHYEQAERLFDALGDSHGVSNVLANRASVLRQWSCYDDALHYQRRALAYYRQSGAQRHTGITLRSMARVHADADQLTEGMHCAQEAVDVAMGLGPDLDIAQALNVLGMIQHRAGDTALAEIATHQAIEFSRRCGSRHEEAHAAHRLGTIAVESGRTDQTRRWWRTALNLYRQLGSAQAERLAADLAELGDQ